MPENIEPTDPSEAIASLLRYCGYRQRDSARTNAKNVGLSAMALFVVLDTHPTFVGPASWPREAKCLWMAAIITAMSMLAYVKTPSPEQAPQTRAPRP
ncbi:MAG: hypothetical protein DHS20C10_01490 [marine bacterium B5-7]|nr:MAG: hypothetical protein DHS20C10_01490 [marine bacterium B5-7]